MSRGRSHHLELLISFALLLATPTSVEGAPRSAARQMKIAIVLDDSGSMLATDPRRLSITAAMIAVELASPEDQLTLIPLNGRRSTPQPGGARSPLLGVLAGLQRRGVETIYDRPLELALRGPGAPIGPNRTVLFLTDGEPSGRSGAKGDEEKLRAVQQSYLERLASSTQGARIFPVALGSEVPVRWFTLFQRVAERSGGVAFRVHDPGELTEVFAEIYARSLGSRVVKRDLAAGRATVARIDPLARVANLVLISHDQAPFEVRYPGILGGGRSRSNGVDLKQVKANAGSAHHYLDRLPPARLPATGELAVELTGASRYRALLVWDYGLALDLAVPVRRPEGGYALTAGLRDLVADTPDSRPEAYGKIVAEVRLCPGSCDVAASGCKVAARLTPRCPSPDQAGCRYEGGLELPGPGRYCVDAVAHRELGGTRLLELVSRQRHPLEVGAGAELRGSAGKLRFSFDQNQDPPHWHWQDCKRLRLEAHGLAAPVRIELDATRLSLPPGVTLAPAAPPPHLLRPDQPLELEVCLRADRLVRRPGLQVPDGVLLARSTSPAWFAGGRGELTIPVEIAITPRSFWNQYKRLLAFLLLGLLLLAFLIWLVVGFVRPHPFPENLKVNWGKSIERLDRNEMPVSEVPQAGRGFYRNAQLWVGGRRCFVGSGGTSQGRFEATGPGTISVFAEEGTSLERVNKFDHEKREPVAAGSPASIGDLFKLGEIFLRLKL
jgi:hypothetical protein